MAKDAKGHGSEKRGGGAGKHYLDPFDPRYPDSAARYASVMKDAAAAKALAAPGNPKSAPAPVHPAHQSGDRVVLGQGTRHPEFRGLQGTVVRHIKSRNVVDVKLDNGKRYDARPENVQKGK